MSWLIRDPHVIVIPGAKSIEQIEANAAVADIDLSDAEWEQLRDAAQAFRRAPLMSTIPNMIARYLRP